MKNLPKPKNKYGYTRKEIEEIIQELDIDSKKFWNQFGTNTCMIDKKGNTIYYICDIERTLWELGFESLGKFHSWD
jgi:hypothetical protein